MGITVVFDIINFRVTINELCSIIATITITLLQEEIII